MEETQLSDRNESCKWKLNKICKIEDSVSCPDDCDLKDLKFDKDEIIKRMKEEENEINRLKKEGIFKNKFILQDKCMGIYVLQKALSGHFGVIEPHLVDKDFEKTANFLTKALVRFRKR